YLKSSGKADRYYEKHLSYWGLKALVRNFSLTDYTLKMVTNPTKYAVDYMIRPGSFKAKLAALITRYVIWLSPGYIWVLEKPSTSHNIDSQNH
ncbi:MAG: hypothetical protein ACE5LB_13715, partial [Acidiferrobacterales bacterium]